MRKIYILMGASGSGKSTWAKDVLARGNCLPYSADHYFTDQVGRYNFDPSKLGEAHGECLREFVDHLHSDDHASAIIDNTNTTLDQIAPYMALALAYGWEVVPLYFLGEYKNRHGVPEHAVKRMRTQLSNLLNNWPRHWPEPQRAE